MKKMKKNIILLILIFLEFLIINGCFYEVKATDENETIQESESLGVIKAKEGLTPATSLPSQYDLRKSNPYGFSNHGYINISAENQVGGTCWDFASMMSLQTHYAQSKGLSTYPTFSKAHLDYLASKYSGKNYGNGRNEVGDGGGFPTTLQYFKSNDGPIYENKCYYTRFWNSSENKYDYANDRVTINGISYYNQSTAQKTTAAALMDKMTPDYYVHETVAFPGVYIKGPSSSSIVGTKNMYYVNNGKTVSESEMKEIRDTIKQHIKRNGGAYCSIRTHQYFIGNNLGSPYNSYDGKYSQYDDGSIQEALDGYELGWHAITIIGWDDNYSKSKFNCKNSQRQIVHPSSNGAWLIINNYGNDSFENGCQWVSYEDYAVNHEIFGYLSTSNKEIDYTYTFEGQSAYEKMKNSFTQSNLKNGLTVNDNTKTIKGVDLIFNNDLKSLNISYCDLSSSDFNVLCSNKLPKLTKFQSQGNKLTNVSKLIAFKDSLEDVDLYDNEITDVSVFSNLTNVKSLSLANNKISDISPLNLDQYEYISLKWQKINKTVGPTVHEIDYPSIFAEARKSSSKLYSSSGVTLTGCMEKGDKTGIVLTSNKATVKITDGIASGTVMTITRQEDNLPTIQMVNSSTGQNIDTGTTIEKNTKVRLIFNDDDGVSGYNITNTETRPSTWITTYDQAPTGNVKIVNKTFSTIGNNYIWVKDSGGNAAKALLIVKGEDILLGDVDGNGSINLTDVLKLRRYIANSTKWNLTDGEINRADVNKDGKLNVSDVLKIRRYIAANSNANIKTKHPDWIW